MNQFPTTKELEQFCREHGFLYHAHGSGKWGSERYWSYYKVETLAMVRVWEKLRELV